MFYKDIINFKNNLFDELSQSANFEIITKGRKGANLFIPKIDSIPLVRTTTIYQNKSSPFLSIHYNIFNKIKNTFPFLDIDFNNALIEIYDDNYCTMGFHSDQSLDLDDNSFIGIFSCYESPNNIISNRKLKIQNKFDKSQSEISLEHNSVVLFSTKTNKHHLHKIILDNKNNTLWLGITFRLSKTYINFRNNIPFLLLPENYDIELTLATDDEKRQFYKLRGLENKNINHEYPNITYTINPSDLLPILL